MLHCTGSFHRRELVIVVVGMLLLCAFSVGFPANQSENNTKSPFCLKTIVLDAGHGGKDPGKVSPWGAKEKDINLSIVLKLATLIREQTEYEVVPTRTTDCWMSLVDRATFANQFPANQTLFISVHCNSNKNSNVSGVESYIFNLEATDALAAKLASQENAEETVNPLDFIINNLSQRGSEKYSWEAARIVQSFLVSQLKSKDLNQKASDRRVRRGPFRVLADTNLPAILVEVGFLSNKGEQSKLSSPAYQERIAGALLEAIQQFDRRTQELANSTHDTASLP